MHRVVAITGGTGFVGRHLVGRHVALGDEVRYLTRSTSKTAVPGAKPVVGDLRSGVGLKSFVAGTDVLYHCAAELNDSSRMDEVNVQGTRRLLESLQRDVGVWVQLSSTGVYGPKRCGVVEDPGPLAPVNPYELSKASADSLVHNAAHRGLGSVIVRPSNVYGPDMTNQSLFHMIRMVDRGLFFFIGSPGATANYVHVENVVDALMLAAGSPLPENGRAYIVSDHCTMEEFVAMIAEALGRKPPRLRLPEGPVRLAARLCEGIPGFPLTTSRIDALTNRVVYSSRRIEEELGYRHRITMADGIGELVRAWKHAKK